MCDTEMKNKILSKKRLKLTYVISVGFQWVLRLIYKCNPNTINHFEHTGN